METCNLSVCLTVVVNKAYYGCDVKKIDKTSFNEVLPFKCYIHRDQNSERVLVVFGLFMTLFFLLECENNKSILRVITRYINVLNDRTKII